MRTRPDPGVFPCPFCHCSEVRLIGGTGIYLYYRCEACAETWSAEPAAEPDAPIRIAPERRPTIH